MAMDDVSGLTVQVTRLSAKFDSEIGSEDRPGHLNLRLTETRDELRALRKMLSGNGSPGIVTRLDRLEQSDKRRQALTFAALVAALGAVVKTAWDVVTMRP